MECGRLLLWLLCLLWLFLFSYKAGDIEKFPGPWKSREFTIAHHNVRGLKGKLLLLSLFILKHSIKMFTVSETFMNDSIPSSFVNIPGYNFERKDRGSAEGGVGFFVKNNIVYRRRNDLQTQDIKLLCLEIMSQNSKSIITCVLSRPPNSSKHLSKSFLETFDKQLSNIIRENKEVIIVGDINFNYLDQSNGKHKELLSLNGFVQVVNGPTRITPNSDTLIDVILTSKPENVCDIKIIPTAISDHDAVRCRRKINNTKDPYEIIRCRNYANYKPEHLHKDLPMP